MKSKKRVLSLFMAVMVVLGSISFPKATVEAADSNVAQGKKVTVSGTEINETIDVKPSNAVDGDENTRWASKFMKELGTIDENSAQEAQWLIIDLAAEKTVVSSIRISYFAKVWAAKYRIETADVTDDENAWQMVKNIENRGGGTLNDNHVDTFEASVLEKTELKRYVRFYFDKVNTHAGGRGVSIKEITIMGSQEESSGGGDEGQLWTGNVATGKTAKASGVESGVQGYEVTPDKAVDGINADDSRWSSGIMKSGNDPNQTQTPQWIELNLRNEVTDITDIKLYFHMKVWSTDYEIQTKDTADADWTTVYHMTKEAADVSGPVDTIMGSQLTGGNRLGKYVRFYFNKLNTVAGGNCVSVREIEINGTQIQTETQPETAQEVLNGISALETITAEMTEVPLPKVAKDFEITVIGSTKENIISNEGHIVSTNIGDREVTLIVEARNKNDETDKARKSFDVVVPSKNEKNAELFPPVDHPNEEPEVIPSLQEWYGYEGEFTLKNDSRIVINDVANVGLQAVAENMQADLEEITGKKPEIVKGVTSAANDIYIESQETDTYEAGNEGYLLVTDDSGMKIYSSTYTGCLYGTITVEQILWQDDDGHDTVPNGVIRDYPDYEIRGVMFDVGRIPHRIQYLKDYTKILNWYKMSEFHLHMNDDFSYHPEALPNNFNQWSGMHRLENNTYPSLTDRRVYTGDKFDYFNEEYADPTYTKEEYKELQEMANARGIDLIAEFDTPSHSTAYIEYAEKNPDKIEWLGPINTTISTPANNKQLLALDINSSNAVEKEHAENARKFIEELFKDYLEGEDPTFKSDTVHVGVDEYWDHDHPEVFRQYANFLADLVGEYGKTARMWGSFKMFKGDTPVDPSNIVLDIWNTWSEDDPNARLAEGFRLVNVPQTYLYVTPNRDHKDSVGEEWIFKNWDPTIFSGGVKTPVGDPLVLGAKTALWGDEFREGATEADTHERMLRAIAITAEKTWGGTDEDDEYIDYQKNFEKLKEGPGTEIAKQIKSETEVILDYDLRETKEKDGTITVKDTSGNGYDASVTGGEVVVQDGKSMIKFDGDTVMTTPLKTVGYPYTVSFDVKALDGNTEDAQLFSGYDGRLLAAGTDGNITIKRSFYTQSSGYAIPTDKTVNLTIVGTFQNTKIYADGKLVKMFFSSDRGQADEWFTTFVFPLEEIGKNFHGYIGNLKVYNKAMQPETIGTSLDEITTVNLALNKEAYAERFGNQPDLNSGDLKRHFAWKATDGDKKDASAQIQSTDPHSYWLSSNHNNDYIMVDLEEVQKIDKVVLHWDSPNYATAFSIQTSNDGKIWTTAKEVSGNTKTVSTVAFDTPVEARYVKMQGVTRNTGYYAVREFEVLQNIDRSEMKTTWNHLTNVIHSMKQEASESEVGKALVKSAKSAEKLYENPYMQQDEADAAVVDMQEKLEAYSEKYPIGSIVDKIKLEETLKEAKKIVKEDYVEFSWADLQEAIEAAQIVYDNSEAKQEQVDDAIKALTDAIHALIPKKRQIDDGTLKKMVKANSEQNQANGNDGPAVWAFDDEAHWWHSRWEGNPAEGEVQNGEVSAANPIWLQSGFDKVEYIKELTYLPRQDKPYGRIHAYELQIANMENPTDNPKDEDFVTVKAGNLQNQKSASTITLDTPTAATHIRLVAKSVYTNSLPGVEGDPQAAYPGSSHVAAQRIKIYAVNPIGFKVTAEKTEYFVGDELDKEKTDAILTFSDGSTANVIENVEITGFNTSAPANAQEVTVIYNALTYGEFTDTFTVTVKEKEKPPVTLEKITVKAPAKTEYEIGEELDLKGMEVTAHYSDGKKEIVEVSKENVKGFDSETAGEKTITVTYKEKTATFTVTVKEKEEPQPPVDKVDKDKLNAAIKEADGKKEADYTEESWKVFADALAAAKKVVKDGKATQNDVDAAKDALVKAQEALVKAGDDEDKPIEEIFDDVRKGDWYYEHVDWAYKNEIMTGYGNSNLFGPANTLNRAEFAKIMYNLAGKPEVEFEKVLGDVKEGDWYADAVIWAYGKGVITGYTDTQTFGAEDEITREQIATILYRYAGKPAVKNKDVLKDFPDANKVSGFAKDAMMWVVENKIITGDKGNLNPLGDANRAEAAAIMQRAIPIL